MDEDKDVTKTAEREAKSIMAEFFDVGDDDSGEFEAVIATLGVVDSDGDVVESGAFKDVGMVPIQPAHNQGTAALGKVAIEERKDKVVAVGKFNLGTTLGRDWYSAIKFDLAHPPAVQEWSWGYIPLDFKFEERDGDTVRLLERVDLLEVSPVLRGASVGTATLSAKRATARHQTPTSTDAWSGAANERNVVAGDTLRSRGPQIYAWRDPDGDATTKAAWRFIHHFVGEDGTPGAASTRACVTGIAVLNGARGGTTIPDADRQGVWRHLAGHLRDAEIEPPELRSAEDAARGLKLNEELMFYAWEAEALLERIRNRSAAREAEGRKLSKSVAESGVELARAFVALAPEMERIAKQFDEMVEHVDDSSDPEPVQRAIGRYQELLARFPQ